MLAATVRLTYERGAAAASVTAICKRAAVSRVAFYRFFATKEACLVAAFEEGLDVLRRHTADAAARKPWPVWALDALDAALELFTSDPALASLLLFEASQAGDQMRQRSEGALDDLAATFAAAAPAAPGGIDRGVLCRTLVGGIATDLSHLLEAELPEEPRSLRGPLGEFLLTPWFGAVEAKRLAGEDRAGR